MSRLARLLWRCEHGYCPHEVMRDAFAEDAARVRHELMLVEGRFDVIRQWDATLIIRFDAEHAAFYQACAAERFRDALNALSTARQLLERCNELLEASELLQRVDRKRLELESYAVGSPLLALPSFSTPSQLLGAAEQEMRCGAYRRAKTIGCIALRYLEPLLASTTAATVIETDEWSRRMQELAAVHAATRSLIATTRATQDQETLHRLTGLFAHHSILAHRALGELEWRESSRRRCASSIRQVSVGMSESLLTELQVLAARSWNAAADRMLAAMLHSSGVTLDQQYRDLQSATGEWHVELDR